MVWVRPVVGNNLPKKVGKRLAKRRRRTVPRCPVCGEKARTEEFQGNGRRHTCCGLASWNGKPLVTPSTLRARMIAHRAFDPIWEERVLMTRSEAYEWLAEKLGLDREHCHMSRMDEETALRVAELSWTLRDLTEFERAAEAQGDPMRGWKKVYTNLDL